MRGGTWWATVCEATESWTQLSTATTMISCMCEYHSVFIHSSLMGILVVFIPCLL